MYFNFLIRFTIFDDVCASVPISLLRQYLSNDENVSKWIQFKNQILSIFINFASREAIKKVNMYFYSRVFIFLRVHTVW